MSDLIERTMQIDTDDQMGRHYIMTETSDYLKYRGKCKEFSEAAIAADPSLTLVRGHYFCPFWGEQPHWWTTKPDGTIVDPTALQFPSIVDPTALQFPSIVDPTALQFPSKGSGEYIPFDGMVTCAQCGKEMKELDAWFDSSYTFCSGTCNMRFVGL